MSESIKPTSNAVEQASFGSGRGGTQELWIASEKTNWFDRWNERASEFCSSILVKETRQALKSRQFVWTYFVLLAAVIIWTLIGLGVTTDGYERGPILLGGFWMILGFPLALIIPFSAYRSLAREFEDGTIDLVSITTMKPRQIVMGKFGSAMLQILMFLSVLAPCIAFTYLLRGIDLTQIVLGLAISTGGSVFLTILGLFLAGCFRSRALGVGVSVLFALLLGWLYVMWCAAMFELAAFGGSGLNFDSPQEQVITYGFVAFFGSTAALLLTVAASQISFSSDNRSSRARVVMIFQQALFVGLAIMVISVDGGSSRFLNEILSAMSLFAGCYWLTMGCLMVGESSHLSRRVMRGLPKSIFSRSMFGLMMPGAGRGFLFALANIWSVSITLIGVGLSVPQIARLVNRSEAQATVGRVTQALITPGGVAAIGASAVYASLFLAIIYLVMLIFAKRKRLWSSGTGPLISFLLGFCLVAGISIASAILHYGYFGMRGSISNVLAFNWFASVMEIASDPVAAAVPPVFYLLAIFAFCVVSAAVAIASRELRVQAVEVPQRVLLESKKRTKRTLPEGESISEIFGELKPKKLND